MMCQQCSQIHETHPHLLFRFEAVRTTQGQCRDLTSLTLLGGLMIAAVLSGMLLYPRRSCYLAAVIALSFVVLQQGWQHLRCTLARGQAQGTSARMSCRLHTQLLDWQLVGTMQQSRAVQVCWRNVDRMAWAFEEQFAGAHQVL